MWRFVLFSRLLCTGGLVGMLWGRKPNRSSTSLDELIRPDMKRDKLIKEVWMHLQMIFISAFPTDRAKFCDRSKKSSTYKNNVETERTEIWKVYVTIFAHTHKKKKPHFHQLWNFGQTFFFWQFGLIFFLWTRMPSVDLVINLRSRYLSIGHFSPRGDLPADRYKKLKVNWNCRFEKPLTEFIKWPFTNDRVMQEK